MQTSLHWSVKRTSFSLLLIMEFTSCSLEEKWHTRVNSRQRWKRSWWAGALIMQWWINKVVQNWVWLLISGIVCSVDLRRENINGHFSFYVDDCCTTKGSPDNVHVRVSVTHVQPQQGSDVIRWHGRAHVPSDDVHPVGKGHYVTSLRKHSSPAHLSVITYRLSETAQPFY